MKGYAYQLDLDDVMAIECYNRAIYLEPKNPQGYYSKSVIYCNQGNQEESFNVIEEALKNCKDDPKILLQKANLQYIFGDTEEALKTYFYVIQIHPRLEIAYNNIGLIQL